MRLFLDKKVKIILTKDVQWIHDHFEELVDNYARKDISVANEKLFIGATLKEAREMARKKYPNLNPSLVHIPHPEDFLCVVKGSLFSFPEAPIQPRYHS